MLKRLFLGVCVGVSFSLFSAYAATAAAECLEGCKNSITREDLEKCQVGCKDGGGSIPVSTSGANADVIDRSMRRKTNSNAN